MYTPQLTFQLMSNHRRVLQLQMLQTFISDYSCLVSLFLHCPTLLGLLTITRIPIRNHKFATLLDYGGVLHLQMLQTFSLIQQLFLAYSFLHLTKYEIYSSQNHLVYDYQSHYRYSPACKQHCNVFTILQLTVRKLL